MTEPAPLQILLVEDNPGDARLIEEMLDAVEPEPGPVADHSAGETHEYAVAPLEAVRSGAAELTHVTRLSEGLERLDETADDPPDVVLLDLNLPDSTGIETLQRVRDRADPVPIVVLTGLQDRQFGVTALTHGAHEYLVKGEINSDLLVRSIYHAIERASYESRIARQHERLETLNRLNALVQDLTQATIGLSTREEIERTLCAQLASSDLYEAAWIGDVAADGEDVTRRADAGVADRVDDVDRVVALSHRAALRAVRDRELQLVRRPDDATEWDEWGEAIESLGCRSAAAIPVVYEESTYGVLLVYSTRPDAFDSREQVVASRLGEVVGHTINAIETKRRLLADTVVELQFESDDPSHFFAGVSADLGCAFNLERIVPGSDDDLLYYVTVEGAPAEAVLESTAELPSVARARQVSEGGDDRNGFEFTITGESVPLTLLRNGARVADATAQGGSVQFVAEVPPGSDVRSIVSAITDSHPTVGFVARREVDRSRRGEGSAPDDLEELLTDRQHSVVQAAYHSGFFEWPRRSTGEEIADSLGISAPTYHEHLRHAQQKLMRELLDGDERGRNRRPE